MVFVRDNSFVYKKSLIDNNNCDEASKGFTIINSDDLKRFLFELMKNKVVLGDSFKVLRKFDDEVFDMVFIDQPYKELKPWKVKIVVEGVNEDWDKFSSFQELDNFIAKLFIELKRVMKLSATIWVIATYHSIIRAGKIMQDSGRRLKICYER